jgi:spermidine synthase
VFRFNPTSNAPLWAFFVSGAAGLVYQVVWARLLGRLVGSDALGIALTLTVFMLGLGLGAPLVARVARESLLPLRLWSMLAGAIAVWALASPFVLGSFDPVASGPLRLFLATAFLLPPTLAMGGTVPAMARVVAGAEPRAGQRTARFYAANTWGAALGAFAGSFLLLPALGLSRTLIAAALAEAAVALWAWRRAKAHGQEGPNSPAPTAREQRPEPSAGSARLALASGLLGAAGLCFEVLATRALTSLMGASTYAFALVLAIFLAGLASGAAWTRRRLERPAPVATWIALLPLAMALGFALVTWRSGGANPFESAINLAPQIHSAPAQWAATELV